MIRGPYRFIRHPNYLVVAIELFALPMTFGASLTAFSFTLLNGWLLLRIRIPMEEKAVYQTKE
jgi:methyltransferase